MDPPSGPWPAEDDGLQEVCVGTLAKSCCHNAGREDSEHFQTLLQVHRPEVSRSKEDYAVRCGTLSVKV